MQAQTMSAPLAGTFARSGGIRRHDPKGFFSHLAMRSCPTKGSDGGSLADAWRRYAHMGRWCVPNAAAVRLKKPAAGFPARALKTFAMMKRCQ